MRRVLATVAAAIVVSTFAAGCKDKVAEMTATENVLSRLHQAWTRTAETIQSSEPKWTQFRMLRNAIYESIMSVEKGGGGDNREQVLAKLKELYKAYEEKVASKLNMMAAAVQPLASQEEIRAAFESLAHYDRELKEMTSNW